MGMKKAGLFSKSGCNWWVTPGSNPSSKEKRANPIYENETQFLREKSPQTLGITGKKHCRTFLFGNDVIALQNRSAALPRHILFHAHQKEFFSYHFSKENLPLITLVVQIEWLLQISRQIQFRCCQISN